MLELLHNGNGFPIHANGSEPPHVTIRTPEATFHVPYIGQTTLGMYGIGQPGGSFMDAARVGGHLDASNPSFTPRL